MIIDTTNDELLINGQRWQRGGYLLATAYSTDQINITARDGRVIGKAIEWDRILDKDKNTFGLDRDGTVTALTNIFNSQVKSPYKIDALRDVENGTAAYGEIMIYRSPGEWQYEVLEQYHGAYDSEAATLRSGATATLELYYTAQADGDGISELSQSNTPASGYQIIRKLYYAERAQQDPDTGTWVQFAGLAANTSFNDAKTALLAYLKERTGGTVPISLKMTWEEVEIYNGLLDSYGGAAAAYSVRRLSSAYTGPLIEVERASDSTTQDIGYDANGDLDTTALTTFCSGTTCTVRTWYDQSSNGNDAVQTTQANQPKIYDSSTGVVTENGKSSIYFDGFTHVKNTMSLINQPITIFDVVAIQSYGSVNYMFDSDSTNTNRIFIGTNTSRDWRFYAGVTVNSTTDAEFAQTMLTGLFDGSGSELYVDSLSVKTGNPGSNGMSELYIGTKNDGTIGIIGNCQELIIYASDQSSNRSGIETNINDYFGIYTPFTTGLLDDYGGAAAAYSLRRLSSTYTGPLIRVRRASDNAEQDISADIEGNLNTGALAAFCSGTNGFVKTWYCQSGNGNDATQTTTADQPKIYDSSTGVITENGIPAILSNGTTTKLANFSVSLTGDYFISLVSKLNTAGSNMWLGTTTTQGYFRAVDTGTSVTIRHNGETGGADFTVSVGTTQLLHTAQRVSTTMHYAQNGVDNTTTERATQGATFDITCLFDGYNNQYEINGTMQEVVIYASDQSSNRTGIETNINDFYSIYP